MPRLTNRFVHAAQPDPAKDTLLWDESLPGFGLRVSRGGSKAFVVQYRPAGSRQARRLTIAKVGTLTTEQARHLAKDKLADVAKGGDPAREKKAAVQAPTVKQLVARFRIDHVERRLKPATKREYSRALDLIDKKLGSTKVAEVQRTDVAKLHAEYSAHASWANKLLAVISKLFTEAEVLGWRTEGSNPARHVKKYPEHKRERHLAAYEISRIGRALTELVSEEKISRFYALYVRLLLTTGTRPGEWLAARWSDVDLENGVLTLPDSKTGPRHVVLSSAALTLLQTAYKDRQANSPWVVTGSRRDAHREWTHHANPQKAWVAIRERASEHREGEPDTDLSDVTLHTLRHTFASSGAAAGVGLTVVGGLLGHRQATTTSRYSHIGDSVARAAADAIAGRISTNLMADPANSAAVVELGAQGGHR